MLTKFFSERSLQSDSKMYLHRSDISNIREVTIGDVLRRSGPYGVLAAKKSGFSTFLPFWSSFRPYWSTGVDQMLTKNFFSERSLQSDSKMYLHRSDIFNIREVTIGNVLRRSGPYGAQLLTKETRSCD